MNVLWCAAGNELKKAVTNCCRAKLVMLCAGQWTEYVAGTLEGTMQVHAATDSHHSKLRDHTFPRAITHPAHSVDDPMKLLSLPIRTCVWATLHYVANPLRNLYPRRQNRKYISKSKYELPIPQPTHEYYWACSL